jgi:hypothetical protein
MRSLVLLTFVAFALGCSNKPSAMMDGGGGGDGGCSSCTDKNPNGDCYPDSNQGSEVGQTIPNFTFQGYLNLDPTMKTKPGTLTTIKLSDFYDPGRKKYKLLRIITSAGWCGPCIMETQYLAMAGSTPEKLAAEGVVFLQALLEGTTAGKASTQMDLDDWIMKWQPNFTELLDPNGANLSVFGAASAVPFSVTVDACSMKILARDQGFSDGSKLDADVSKYLAQVKTSPACGCAP